MPSATEEKARCPLCDSECKETISIGSRFLIFVECAICGEYIIESILRKELRNHPDYGSQRFILSALSKSRVQGKDRLYIMSANIKELIESAYIPKDPVERIDKVLLLAQAKVNEISDSIEFKHTEYPLAYAKSPKEFDWLIKKAREIGFLEDTGGKFNLTLQGWKRLSDLKTTPTYNNKVFVAMWFASEMLDYWEN